MEFIPVTLRKVPSRNQWEVHYSLTNSDSNWSEVFEWCWRTFGHPGTDPNTGTTSSWDYHGGRLYFYDEKCATMYALKWT